MLPDLDSAAGAELLAKSVRFASISRGMTNEGDGFRLPRALTAKRPALSLTGHALGREDSSKARSHVA
jgi:hypothetical protein